MISVTMAVASISNFFSNFAVNDFVMNNDVVVVSRSFMGRLMGRLMPKTIMTLVKSTVVKSTVVKGTVTALAVVWFCP